MRDDLPIGERLLTDPDAIYCVTLLDLIIDFVNENPEIRAQLVDHLTDRCGPRFEALGGYYFPEEGE